jgi:hypothetical protein
VLATWPKTLVFGQPLPTLWIEARQEPLNQAAVEA